MENQPFAVSMAKAAELVSVSRPTLYRWARIPGFPVIRVGGCTRVVVDDLKLWVHRQAAYQQQKEGSILE